MVGLWKVVSNETVLPSGSEPSTCRPSHSAMPPRVPIHRVSPATVMVVTLSTGSPSNAFTSSQVVRSALRRLTPDANVPTHRRPERS